MPGQAGPSCSLFSLSQVEWKSSANYLQRSKKGALSSRPTRETGDGENVGMAVFQGGSEDEDDESGDGQE
jgi:hypothetical protein